MKKIITYGTFDLFHIGHENLLRRAKELGDWLIVGVTAERFDKERGKLNVHNSLMQRIDDVRRSGYADEIIVEEYEGQKIEDIVKKEVDIFAIGSDWLGRFDYLKEYCNVVYLERTKGISSTQLRTKKQHIVELGIIGAGRIANRFIPESKFVSGVIVKGVFNPNEASARAFCEKHELLFYSSDFDDFTDKISAVYIASPHLSHYDYVKKCLGKGLHVLCEKPMVLSKNQAIELYAMAKKNNLVLIEALKTAYSPGFTHLISLVKSGVIGEIHDIDSAFTGLKSGNLRELDPKQAGGSMTELASYVLLPIFKIFGTDYKNMQFFPLLKNGIDIFTRGILEYECGVGTFKVGLGVKTEGELIISGTKGYAYVPAPWWKTEYFELRFEDANQNKKYFYKFDGDGLRYELNEFVRNIALNYNNSDNYLLKKHESIAIIDVIDRFLKQTNRV
ncbi:MAG: Gfo/Idh/MocA family oxidoreductase [Prevotellaceae bacterium]|jgi:glycerol-3-phosphate cytidylyltransferase|nr:Gfo/Idh/MocA family oxidoreductase [Prevotellaceae bacterium]